MRKVGMRVGAISHTDNEAVYLFGYGVYEGDHVPPEGIGFGFPNPRIKLDSGQHVYGCECWWRLEERIRKEIGDRKVVEVDIDEWRKQENTPE